MTSSADPIYIFHQGNGNSQLYCVMNDGIQNRDIALSDTTMAGTPSSILWPPSTSGSGTATTQSIYTFYQGTSSSINYTEFNTSNWSWQAGTANIAQLEFSPSAVVFTSGSTSTIYLFYYTGGHISYITSTDGATWSTATNLTTVLLSLSPSAVVFNSTLYVFYRDNASSELHYITSTDGATWSAEQSVTNNSVNSLTGASPNAVVYGKSLYVFYKDYNGSSLHYSIYSETNSWGAQQTVNGASLSGTPSAFYNAGNKLLYVFHHSQLNSFLQYSVYNGTNWLPDFNIGIGITVSLGDSPGAISAPKS